MTERGDYLAIYSPFVAIFVGFLSIFLSSFIDLLQVQRVREDFKGNSKMNDVGHLSETTPTLWK